MTDIRIDKILVGSPSYKVLVGESTKVEKIVVGIPLSTITIGPYVDIDNIVGLDTSGATDGGVITYDSDAGGYIVTDSPVLEVDGKTYPSDSAHTNILIRRSGTQGEPVILQQGELAYSYLTDPSTNGFGNGGDRLYIATGANNDSGYSTNIETIGGKYFTDLLNHQHGTLTANSALIVDASKTLDQILADSATFVNMRATGAVYTPEVILTQSFITSDSAMLRDGGGTPYLTWSDGLSGQLTKGLAGYYDGKRAFYTDSALISGSNEVGLTSAGFIRSLGLIQSRNLLIDSDAVIKGNLTVEGTTTQLYTNELLIKDKRIIIAEGIPTARDADQSGIAVGDSNTPIATITYVNNGVDAPSWTFDPGINAPFINVEDLEFSVIDCGTYA
jgi:hypothetical protein